MESPQLGLEFEYEYEKENRNGPFISDEESIMTYTERLDIHTRGWIYHPGLAVYSFTYSPEWEQVREKPGNVVNEAKSFLHGFTANMRILQYKPYSLNLFAHKKRTTINSNFAQRSEIESTGYGGTLSLRNRIVPAALSYAHSEDEQTGLFETSGNRDEVHLNATFVKLGDTVLSASYIDSRQNTQNTIIDSEQQTVRLKNVLSPRGLSNISLSSSLNYTDNDSTFQQSKRGDIYERLSWTHSDSLSTYYSLRYEEEDRFEKATATESDRQLLSGDFSLSHILYENLTTNLLAAASQAKYEDDEEIEYILSGKFDYKRSIPNGMLYVNISQNIDMVDENIVSDSGQIYDETVPLKTGEISFLEEENVELDSIIVTDTTGLTIYFRYVDYSVTEVDTLTRISCITGSQLDTDIGCTTTGGTVLVTYQYNQRPSFDYYTYSQSYGVNVNLWAALTLYYRVSFVNQYYVRGIRPDTLTDDILRLGGVELAVQWSKTNLEFENNDSTTVPIRASRIRETITLRPTRNVYMYFTVNYSDTKFKDSGETETFNGMRAKVQVLTSRQSQLSLTGFRDRVKSDDKLTVNTGFTAQYIKVWRIYQLNIDYTYSFDKDKITDERIKNQFLLFKIRREVF